MAAEREVIFEFLRVGAALKVTAVDAETGLPRGVLTYDAPGWQAISEARELDAAMGRFNDVCAASKLQDAERAAAEAAVARERFLNAVEREQLSIRIDNSSERPRPAQANLRTAIDSIMERYSAPPPWRK